MAFKQVFVSERYERRAFSRRKRVLLAMGKVANYSLNR
jgi:hypothetical protein